MANLISQKSLVCIEWTVSLPPEDKAEIFSESFKVQGYVFNFKFSKQNRSLYITARYALTAEIEVLVTCIPCNFRERRFISKSSNKIWEYPLIGRPLENYLTFEIIIYPDSPKDADAQPSKKINLMTPTPSSNPFYNDEQSGLDATSNMHFETLSKDFLKLLGEDSSCDVQIMCNGKPFKAHQIVLKTRSSVLSKMLKFDEVENESGVMEININDISVPTFRSFLQYLYSGTLPEINVDTARELFIVGDKYNVKELKLACETFMLERLSASNAWEVLLLADLHVNSGFRYSVISYIINEKLPKSDKNWPDFCKNHPTLAMEVQDRYIEKY